jgi:hypothetical protein
MICAPPPDPRCDTPRPRAPIPIPVDAARWPLTSATGADAARRWGGLVRSAPSTCYQLAFNTTRYYISDTCAVSIAAGCGDNISGGVVTLSVCRVRGAGRCHVLVVGGARVVPVVVVVCRCIAVCYSLIQAVAINSK